MAHAVREQINTLEDLGMYDEARAILNDIKNFDIDLSSSRKYLRNGIRKNTSFIGFAGEEEEMLGEMADLLVQFYEKNKDKTLPEMETNYTYTSLRGEQKLVEDSTNDLLLVDYSCSSDVFKSKMNEELSKHTFKDYIWVPNDDCFVTNDINDIKTFSDIIKSIDYTDWW